MWQTLARCVRVNARDLSKKDVSLRLVMAKLNLTKEDARGYSRKGLHSTNIVVVAINDGWAFPGIVRWAAAEHSLDSSPCLSDYCKLATNRRAIHANGSWFRQFRFGYGLHLARL
ncbi:hypothetical protein Asal01_03378 [Fodinibius salicampi]